MSNAKDAQSANYRTLSIVLYIFGTVFGMILIGASVYADFESTLFDATIVADSSVRPISCPVFLATNESGTVSAVVKNTESRSREFVVRAHISRGHLILIREVQNKFSLNPGESQSLDWEVTEQDAAYGHLILAKVIVLDDASKPSHKGSCGIIVLNLPGNMQGIYLFFVLLILSLVGLIGGMIIWRKYGRLFYGRRLEATRSIFGLGTLIIGGLIFVVLGLWEVAAVAFYISLLMIGVIVPHFLLARGSLNNFQAED